MNSKNKKEQEGTGPQNEKFNIKIKADNSYLIKLLENCKYLNMKIKSNDLIIFEKNNRKIKLNLIDINNEENKSKVDCAIMEYDINDEKNFEDIKLLWKEKFEGINTNLKYLIGIKKDSDEEKTKLEATNFCENNILKFFIISDKEEKDIKIFIDDLLDQLGKRRIIIENNKIKTAKKNEYKICFVGSCGCGAKTSLICAMLGEKFEERMMTSGSSYALASIEFNNKNIALNLWDTCGSKTYRQLSKIALKDCDCVVIGFTVTNNSSFQEVREWYNLAKENCDAKLMYLIGNQIDLFKDKREVNEEEARNLAKELNLRYFETSCRTGEGVYNFFYDLANEIVKY